jgi:hypothetical protein
MNLLKFYCLDTFGLYSQLSFSVKLFLNFCESASRVHVVI